MNSIYLGLPYLAECGRISSNSINYIEKTKVVLDR
jgi:hypothetical protein